MPYAIGVLSLTVSAKFPESFCVAIESDPSVDLGKLQIVSFFVLDGLPFWLKEK
jgi:hypothetical protein